MAAVSFVCLQCFIYTVGVCYISATFLNVTVLGVLYEVRIRHLFCAQYVFQSVRLCVT